MPKESKKFINPLLRPSQEPEVKAEPPPRLQKNLISDPPVVESILPTRETEPLHIEEASSQGEKAAKKEFLPASQLTATSTDTSTSTYTSSSAPVQEKLVRGEPKNVADSQYRVSAVSDSDIHPSTVTDDQQESFYSPSVSRAIVIPEEPVSFPPNGAVGESSSSPSSKITSTSTSTDTSTSPFIPSKTRSRSLKPLKNAVDQDQEEKRERPSFRAGEALRRKKGPLAFEKTHERITLWIDKGLKQAFEELAFDRDLPKTALLNEAVADLLRKYEI